MNETIDDVTRANNFFSLWREQKKTMTSEQKESIGQAYLKHGIGVDDEKIDDFLRGRNTASYAIGMRQGGVEQSKNDLAAFWKDVISVTPNCYSPDDVSWLCGKGGSIALYSMLLTIDPPWEMHNNSSALIGKIHRNACIYK